MGERNDGTRLERLVEMLEGMKLPEGFTIEKNAPVYNDEGQQIAELDILISGKIGSVLHRTLFECRDRPSEGAAPVGWIEQLFGRKQRLKLSAIVAVSTTGFSPGAITFAQQENIPLRSVEALTEDEIRGLLPKTAPLWETEGKFSDVHVVAVPEDITPELLASPDVVVEIESTRFATADKVFLHIESNKLQSMSRVWSYVLSTHNAEAFKDVPMNWEWVPKTIETREDIRKKFVVVSEGMRGRIDKLTFTATVRHRISELPLVDAVSYSGGDDPETIVGVWKGGGKNVAEISVTLLTRRERLSAG